MQYRTNHKNGDKLSALSFGCMRLPKSEKEAKHLIMEALKSGVNYFDTAYFYQGNEALLGRIMYQEGIRPQMKLATKCPQFFVKKSDDFQKYIEIELQRLQTNYIDYYLMHMLTHFEQWERLCSLGVKAWIAEKKDSGEIRNIGFSYHGDPQGFCKIIDSYPWDFCMIQYNYLDVQNQAGKAGLLYASEKGIPVMVMEPLQGGRLATGLPDEVTEMFVLDDATRTPAQWGLHWVLNQPQVLTVLSGMNTLPILHENINIAQKAYPNSLSQKEEELFEKARKIILQKTHVPCTGCRYCMPCPIGVNIPLCFECDNLQAVKGTLIAQSKYITYVWEENAGKCKKCGKCEEHCPQKIPIRQKLSETASRLERFPYHPMKWVVGKVMHRKNKCKNADF